MNRVPEGRLKSSPDRKRHAGSRTVTLWVRVSDLDRPSAARLPQPANRRPYTGSQGRPPHSNGSGCKLKSFSPAAFFSAYFFIQASQLLPAAVSRPVNASAPISAYDTATFSFEFFG